MATFTGHVAADLASARAATLALIEGLTREDLERQVSPFLSPLVWDLGHIAAYEDLWAVHRLGGEPVLRPDLAALYDAFETPRHVRGDLPLLDLDAAVRHLDDVRGRTLAVLDRCGPSELHELVLRHELQHTETMRQALGLRGLPGGRPQVEPSFACEPGWVEIPAGPMAIGATDEGFSYDNERPRHRVAGSAFRIARAPVTNASWLSFAEGGGYERREWWSDEGWAWKECYDDVGPGDPAAPHAPVQHVSWFEADAFARSRGARLPTEAEWEKAATWEHDPIGGIGAVWEWTASEFGPYPGFSAHPYREYSEVFFGLGYRVLRGGSWATPERVATRTFRNWDMPQRCQIFSGLRLAR